MIRKLVLFGATGDLAGRFLLPALAGMLAAGRLPDGFKVVGAAPEDFDDGSFRLHVAERLERHAAPDVPAAAREALVASVRYARVDLDDAKSVGSAIAGTNSSEPLAAYLALPPKLFAAAITALGEAGLPPGSRIAVEKPFGEHLDGAVALNALLAEVAGEAGEAGVFRVDHALGMAPVQDLVSMPKGGAIIEPAWRGRQIEEIRILWEETLALEGRAGFYDGAGALKDVMQNHMLQVLALVAMEPPEDPDPSDLGVGKLAALRSLRPPASTGAAPQSRRARYTAGRLTRTGGAADRSVPDYAAEEGVDPTRGTETFAEVVLESRSPSWKGTRFVLRAGKALAEHRRGVLVRFAPSDGAADQSAASAAKEDLWIGFDTPATDGEPLGTELEAYSRVLLDVLTGGTALSVRGDEAEEAWRVLTPVLDAWAKGSVPLEEYAAGSTGPVDQQPLQRGK